MKVSVKKKIGWRVQNSMQEDFNENKDISFALEGKKCCSDTQTKFVSQTSPPLWDTTSMFVCFLEDLSLLDKYKE